MNIWFSMIASYSQWLQANIRVDDKGTARIAGFASAVFLPESNATSNDDDESFEFSESRWCSPEILHPGSFGSTRAKATKAVDIYAFGMLAYEVCPNFRVMLAMLNLYSDFLRPGAVPR